MAVTQIQMQSFDQYISDADLSVKPHQTRAVSWCLKKELATQPSFGVRGGLIADDMGLGKTVLRRWLRARAAYEVVSAVDLLFLKLFGRFWGYFQPGEVMLVLAKDETPGVAPGA